MAKEYRFKTKYLNHKGYVRVGRYASNDALVIELQSTIGEPLSKPTTNLEGYGHHPAVGNVFVRDDDQYEGMVECLQSQRIIGPTIRVIEFGFEGVAHECHLLVTPEESLG